MTEREELIRLVSRIPAFEALPLFEQLPVIAWYLERVANREAYTRADLRRCLQHLDIDMNLGLSAESSARLEKVLVPEVPPDREEPIFLDTIRLRLHWKAREKLDKELSVPDATQTSTCFVIQPFDRDKYDHRYKDIFQPAITKAGFKPYRVDEDPSVTIPIEQIENGIKGSAVCLAEITTDNANVWFELGYAIACNKPLLLICEREARTKLPFDVQHRTVILYDTKAPSDYRILRTQITQRLKAVVRTLPAK
jgi:hypothetical protein